MQYCKTWFFGSYCNAISFATREAMGTALKPVAPISGLIFFLVNKLKILTKKIPPAIDKRMPRNRRLRCRSLSGSRTLPWSWSPRRIIRGRSCCVHDAVGSGIEQTERIGSDLFYKITEHQHTDQRNGAGNKQATTVVTTIGR